MSWTKCCLSRYLVFFLRDYLLSCRVASGHGPSWLNFQSLVALNYFCLFAIPLTPRSVIRSHKLVCRWSTASPPLSPLIYPASDKFYNLSFLMCPRNVCCLILIHSINVLFVAVLSYAIPVRIDISVSHFHLLLMKDSRVIFSFLLYDLKFFLL